MSTPHQPPLTHHPPTHAHTPTDLDSSRFAVWIGTDEVSEETEEASVVTERLGRRLGRRQHPESTAHS